MNCPLLFTWRGRCDRDKKIEVGASDEYIFRAPKLYGTRTSVPIIIYGYIVYSDERGNTRTTAFCRAWDFGIERFRNIDDPDYEYED